MSSRDNRPPLVTRRQQTQHSPIPRRTFRSSTGADYRLAREVCTIGRARVRIAHPTDRADRYIPSRPLSCLESHTAPSPRAKLRTIPLRTYLRTEPGRALAKCFPDGRTECIESGVRGYDGRTGARATGPSPRRAACPAVPIGPAGSQTLRSEIWSGRPHAGYSPHAE
jgi:hypothetical protein